MDVREKIKEIENKIKEQINSANTLTDLEKVRVECFGKKSELIKILKSLGEVSNQEKPILGKMINDVKVLLNQELENKINFLENKNSDTKESLDITLPGKPFSYGHLHPITQVLDEIVDIFKNLGFSIAKGPDIETDYYNFTALNFPMEHPARDAQDTFFLKSFKENPNEKYLLRTHTSPVQIRHMLENKPPFQIIIPGSVYRCDSDVSHTPMFHQVEGLSVGQNISFSDLKGVLITFVHRMFGKNTNVRFRPSFFPFTEPSAEIDISCVICQGKGCRVCKDTGWLEILGSGMVHPNVFKSAGYNPDEVTGFAFGMGVERIVMLKFGIDDIRLLFENDVRFLKQF
jgi:phenylalanyl-tRNA synthetase alpha chain